MPRIPIVLGLARVTGLPVAEPATILPDIESPQGVLQDPFCVFGTQAHGDCYLASNDGSDSKIAGKKMSSHQSQRGPLIPYCVNGMS